MTCTFYFTRFCIFPPRLLRPFCPRVFTLADHWNIFVKLRHQTYSAISFQKFSNNCILISGMPVSWKIKDFWFWPVFNKIFRFFYNNWIFLFLDTSQGLFSEYVVLYGEAIFNKLHRSKNQKKYFLCKFFFFCFSPIRQALLWLLN